MSLNNEKSSICISIFKFKFDIFLNLQGIYDYIRVVENADVFNQVQ